MDLRQVGAFVDVALNGSFARAAVIVGIAQSVLSRQVAALEREVGGRLLHRTGRGVALTELGERMLPRARALVADAAGFAEAARNERERPSGEVTLGVVPVASRRLVAEIVRQMRQDHPAVRLRVLEAYSGQVEEMLASGRVDIAIYNRYRRGRVVNAEIVGRSDVHLIVRRDHVLAGRREIALRLLAGVPLAMPVPPNSLTSMLVGLAAAQKFNLDMSFESGSTTLTKEVILESDLATISPRHVFAAELAAGDLRAVRIVRPALEQTTWLSLTSLRPPSAAMQLVVKLIRQLATRR